jgi:1-acyl-sn-glycerol-3-phosphate acyltransferase
VNLDGFQPTHREAFSAFEPETARRFHALVHAVARVARAHVSGLEKLPRGRALIVANHTFGWDVMVPMAKVYCETQRPVWALGEHAWWKVPFVRRLAAAVGNVDGTPENADKLLSREELVLVLPGGLREAVKPHELRYRLLWGRRFGFVRCAIRNRAPIVPLACVGGDDVFEFVGDAYARGRRWLGRRGIPIPFPTRVLPIPHRVRITFAFGDPIETNARPEDADDPAVLTRVRHEVEGALHELIEIELARRAGIDLT